MKSKHRWGAAVPFNGFLGLEVFEDAHFSLTLRQAVRAVIIRDGQILMIRSDRGDYKLPGGGIEEDESQEKALLREVAEETGYSGCSVKENIGTVTERYADAFEPETYFEMISHYYMCELTDFTCGPLRLSAQEREQNFRPVWIALDEALRSNHGVLLQHAANRWIHRENFVLSQLKTRLAKRQALPSPERN